MRNKKEGYHPEGKRVMAFYSLNFDFIFISFKPFSIEEAAADGEKSPISSGKEIEKFGSFSKREHELLILLTECQTN
ncbi:hypothetical protein UP17_05660 [Peribacillus simplex]|uniref:hypothetical protein n=1 Tax=Peribacillus simplex TaxID=1478 RepID=UPI000777DD82|nr:hypothetical protein [Peribacillus simplex]AMM92091.1 hypothetical protein UP17_05660 [Peribacillus simplex]